MNAKKILCLMAAVLMLSGCSKGVDGSQASSKAAESSGKADSSVCLLYTSDAADDVYQV